MVNICASIIATIYFADSTLACIPQANTETARLVCLEPVKWMFSELDTDGNNALSMEELRDIEHIKAENCIKPFISGCDADKDGYVVLSEFCACLCTSKLMDKFFSSRFINDMS